MICKSLCKSLVITLFTHHFLRACAQRCLPVQWCLGGGVFISPAPAYADGYVAPDGNIYYGYKSDANYSKERFKIEVHYYSNKDDADNDTIANQDPLGKFVHVKYTANLNSQDNSFDKWAFRPMWWYGVPAGLTNVHNIEYSRFEKYTDAGKPATVPGSTNPSLKKDSENTTNHYKDSKDWKSISRFYVDNPSQLKSMNGLGMLLGVDGGKNNGYDSNGTSAGNWEDFYAASKGMQGMFIDWESAGKRFYEMDYVAELTDEAWKNRDEHPLRFAAGVYRFAGNWHIATGQIHRAPKIADSLKVKYPTQTPVKDKTNLKPDEKDAVKTAINKANAQTPHFSDLLDGNAGITVGTDGTATLTFKDKTTLTMPGNLLVVEDKKDNVKFPPVYPAPMGVVNPQKLSDADQQAIIKGFKDANKGKEFLSKVSTTDSDVYKFDNNKQELTITYTDGSTITVPYSSLVYQGATIADWAPYVVPAPIDVVNPSSLTEQEKKQVTDAFDAANADLDVYTAAKKEGKTPVSFDNDFKNAIITWADGSTSKIPSWQFLTKKAAAPTPDPSTPKPTEEKKTFTVDVPQTQSNVGFDPFNATQKDITDNQSQLNTLKAVLKKCAAKDAKDGSTAVTINEVEYAIVDGKGVIRFKANNYEDAVYPMSVFFKQMANKQTPRETEHSPQGNTQYKYKVKPVQTVGDTPNIQEQIKALKEFIKSNYGKDLTNDSAVTQTYSLVEGDTPVAGTEGMQRFVQNQHGGAGILTINIGADGSLEIQGYEKGNSSPKTLFTVPTNELYVKSGSATDHTVSDLKQQAKELLAKRKGEGLKDSDFAKAGIDNPANLNDNTINGMNEQQLRELIRKLTDAKKAERKYNEPGVVEIDKGATDDAKFKAAVKAFLKANYANPEVVTDANITSPLTLPSTLTAKNDTVYMGIDADGIKSLSKDASNNIVITASDNSTFTVNVKYKEKDATPSPTPGDDKQLQEMKKQAEELIDRNPKLTKEQKESFKQQIEKAKTKAEIQNILKEANKQAGQSTVKPEDIKKKQEEEKKQHELDAAKDAAKKAIEALTHLSNEEKQEFEKQLDGGTVKNPADVQKIVDAAKLADELKGAKEEAQKATFVFLDHGKGGKDDSSDPNHNEDAALNELLGTKPAEDSTLKTLADKLKEGSKATAAEIRDALNAAKRANAVNEQNAKNAGIAKLEAKKAELVAAYNALTPEQQANAQTSYDAATKAIDDAKTTVKNATKPSEIKNAVDGVDTKIDAANGDIKKNTPKRDTTGNTNDPDKDTFNKEKEKAKDDIDNIPGLSKEEKDNYKEQINQSTHKGDPEAIVNQAKKHTKIAEALEKIKEFKHLNNAQRDTFKAIINETDAHDHKDADGKDLGIDDIDVALANAANTDNAMARLGELKKKANDFKNEKDGKYSKLTNSDDDQNKKKAFDGYLADATTLTKADQGDAKNADQVNELYNDLLKAMRAIDPDAQSAGLKTDALAAEIKSDKGLKPDTTVSPATKGDSVYTTASQDKKTAFDKALTAAETALQTAEDTKKPDAKKMSAEEEATAQKAVDEALDKLIKARLALDGVNTKPLQEEIDKDSKVKNSDKYTYSTTTEKKTAFDNALKDAQELIDKLTGKKQASADDHLDTKENKQKALDDALAKLKAAEEALDGKKPIEPTPTPSVDKSHLQQGINGSGDVKKSDDYNNAPSDKKQAYDHALDHANEVNNDPNATQEQVNQAAEDLHNAQKDLHDSATVNKSYLQWEVSDDVAFRGRGSYLVADASLKDAYNAALSEARRVLGDANATQDQVNAALAKLREAKRNILQANGLSGEEYAGDGTTGTGNTGSTPGTGNTGAGNTGAGDTGAGDFGFGNTGTVPGSGDSGFGSTGSTNAGTTAGTTNSGSGHEGDASHGFGVNDNAPTTVDKGELNLQIEGAESGSKPGSNSGAAGNGSNSDAGAAGNAAAGTTGAGTAGNAAAGAAGNAAGNAAAGADGSNAGNAAAGSAAANGAENSAAANGLAAAKVNAVVENSQAVKRADAQVAAAEAAVNTALAEAKKVAADPNATQAQVDAAAQKLADARKSLAAAQDNASKVRAAVREQVLKSVKGSKLSKTGSDVSVFGMFAAGVAAAGAALFVSKRRGISRHCSK